uniref:Catechol O-methyltransferase domain-containing protein 1 n=1 Tax=Heterorhabditis bacteriophora TaxID=37862 RepID=A0A1I7XJW5_HETBA
MSIVTKSYENSGNVIVDYCSKLSVRQHELQKELQELTIKSAPMAGMLGAPEVLTLGANFIQLIGAKNILDIGTFTGASALAWSLAAGDNGKVNFSSIFVLYSFPFSNILRCKAIYNGMSNEYFLCAIIQYPFQVLTLDINHDNYRKFGLPIIKKCEKTLKKIVTYEAPALNTLDQFLTEGREGTFDFVFIDADKENYPSYYERAVRLIKSGGVIMVDNALWNGRVAKDISTFDKSTKFINETNYIIFNDNRTNSSLINCGDGIHIAFKK